MRRLNERKKGETERNIMIKEEAAEDISGGRKRVAEKNRRGESTSDEEGRKACARERGRDRGKRSKARGYAEGGGRGEMRRRRRIEAGCCAVTVH